MRNSMKKLYSKYIKGIVILIPLLLLTTCKTVVPENNSGKNIQFQVLITNSHSNFPEQRNLIIESSEALQEILATINSTRKPGISIPKVNFENENVAFINIGETSTGGHSVVVKKIIETEASVVIYYEGKSPKAGENATMVITSPFTMVKFKKQSKPVEFEWVLNRK